MALVMLALGCNGSSASDGESGADLPDDQCGDGEIAAGEVCFTAVVTPIPARSLHAGDLDGDTRPDIATFALDGSDYVGSLWRNAGTGEFSLASELDLPGTAGLVPKLARFDDDAIFDIVAFEIALSEGRVATFLSDGEWGVSAPADVLVEDGGEPWNSAVVVDLDGDGLDDVLAEPYASSGTLYVLRNTGGALEVSPKLVESAPDCWYAGAAPVPAFGGFAGGVVFVPGECTEVETSAVSLVLAQPGGQLVSTLTATTGSSPSVAAAGDFDGDGAVEVLVWDRALQRFDLFRATFVGALEPVSTMSLTELCPECAAPEVGAANLRIDAAQFDGDSASDLMLSFNVSLHFGLNPLASSPAWSTWPVDGTLVDQLVLDVDGDGIDDAIYVDDATYVLLNEH